MQTAVTGTYFDGKSSRPYAARIWLEPDQLRIDYHEPDQPVPTTIYWQPARIRPDQPTDRPVSVLTYGDYPAQTLEVDSPDFATQLAKHYVAQPLRQPADFLPVRTIKPWFWLVAVLLLSGAIGFYFWGLPLVVDRVARALPPAADAYLGKQLYARVVTPQNQSGELTRYVRGFYRQLRTSGSYPIQVAVITDESPNAFALPGSYLVVHRGILTIMRQPEELAALLGHEAGHVYGRHITRALFRSLSSYLLISLILGDVSGITAVIIQNADALKHLQYSRRLEREADQFSFQLLRRHQIHPRGLVLLFRRLQAAQAKKGGGETQELLATHPALMARIRETQALIRKYPYSAHPPDSLQYYWQKIKAVK